MNKVVLVGRLVKDPEIRYTQGTTPMCMASYTLAVDRRFKKEGEQSADFISCKCFGKLAEVVEKYYKKGTKIALSGRIQTGSYKNKDGNTVYTTDIVVEESEFAESKASSSINNNTPSNQNAEPMGDGFMSIPDGIGDELPFD